MNAIKVVRSYVGTVQEAVAIGRRYTNGSLSLHQLRQAMLEKKLSTDRFSQNDTPDRDKEIAA
jgi:hypothetical protein